VRKKGVLDVAAAFRSVAADRPDARLRVVGPDAPDKATGAPSTWALLGDVLGPAAGRATWEGAQPWDRMAEVYASASVLLVPSHAEAQPLVWLEAMATGLPVVAYDLPWAREVVEHGRTGLLVPPGDQTALATAVGRLLDEPGLRHDLGGAAARRARAHFDVEVLLPRIEERYAATAALHHVVHPVPER
jgi:glycosyltransferase involved in cell wall biosynthesis